MTRAFQFLQSTPKSKAQRLGLLISLIILTIFVSAGFCGLANRIASGKGIFQPFANLNPSKGTGDSPQLLGFDTEFVTSVPIPEGMLTPWDGTGRVTVLVMGLDYRDWATGEGPSRTDTMMLLTLDPLNNTAGMLSIPRDLWVSIPGFENGRINTAYFLGEAYQMPGGGPGLAVKTVEQLLGVEINYYAQIDFGSFIRFVDELGGVKIDLPKKIKIDPIAGDPVKLKPGRQVLNGEFALAYARARYTAGGDFDRALRQQQVILGIRERLLRPDDLSLLISKAPVLYSEIANGVQTNMTLEELIKLALIAQKVPEDNISHGAISAQEVIFAESPDGQSVLVPLPEKIRQLRDEIFLVNSGTLGPLLPGTSQERMVAEEARIVLLNGSLVDGLASQTQNYLQTQGVSVVEISNGQFSDYTKILDYTGNPHTIQYLMELFDVLPEYYDLQYDPNSPVDVVVTLGADWSIQENPQP
jgi:LCP family protein required for cell wall assembly